MDSGMKRRKNAGLTSDNHVDSSDLSPNNSRSISGQEKDLDFNHIKPFIPQFTLMEELFLLGLKDDVGHLSFWNDSISYILRALILAELILRDRLVFSTSSVDSVGLAPSLRKVEVIKQSESSDDHLIDEAVKVMRQSKESLDSAAWIAYLNGETWNFSKLSYQLKMVRERIAKGLVEKGVLRNSVKSYVVFEVSAYPTRDGQPKREIVSLIRSMLVSPCETIITSLHHSDERQTPLLRLRRIILALATHTAEVLDNLLDDYQLEAAMQQAEGLLSDFSTFPPTPHALKLLGINKADQAAYFPYLELISSVVTAMKLA